MPLCPSCRSHAGGDAAFCSQCGAWLGGARGRTIPRRSFRLPVVTAGLVLAALAMVIVVLCLPERREAPASGKQSLARKDEGSLLAAVEGPADGGAVAVSSLLPEPQEPEPLDAARATRLVSAALVVLDLRTEDDRPLRETRGVFVDPAGVVLCRLHPLLGAHHGSCRLSRPDGARAEITGLSQSLDAQDLALLRVVPQPEGYPALPLLEAPPFQVLHAGDAAFVSSGGRAQESAVAESYAIGPDGLARVLLSETPPISTDAFVALDAYGSLIGLCRLEVEGRFVAEGRARPSKGFRIFVDPAHSISPALGREVVLTLHELTVRLYEGSFDDFFTRALQMFEQKRWGEAIDLFELALARAPQDQPEAEDITRATQNLRESYIEESQRLLAAGRTEEAAGRAESALARYGADAILLEILGEARLEGRRWAEAIAALIQARQLDPAGRVASLLERAYLEVSSEAGKAGDARLQEAHLLQGLGQLPDSGALHLELGKLYARLEAYDDAIRLLRRAAELDPSLRESAENLLGRIDDALKRRDAVVVPIPPGSKSIRTQAVVDGGTQFSFIVDTGATYTTIPSDLAESLGYDISSSRVPRVNISAVGGTFQVPMIRIQSLDLGGYVVRNLDVLAVSRGFGPEVGLIGLNFLKHFKYTVDSARNEFRIERP